VLGGLAISAKQVWPRRKEFEWRKAWIYEVIRGFHWIKVWMYVGHNEAKRECPRLYSI
jgi:hypothetical protein